MVVEKEVEKEVTKVVEKEVTKVVEKEKVVEVAALSERQSPMLQEMIASGTLPPLEERLPVSPLVETGERNESIPGAGPADRQVRRQRPRRLQRPRL
jgi:hypothetical protein